MRVCCVVACLLPSFHRYQFILLGNRGTWVWTTCLELFTCYRPAWESNLQPFDLESVALPLHHQATIRPYLYLCHEIVVFDIAEKLAAMNEASGDDDDIMNGSHDDDDDAGADDSDFDTSHVKEKVAAWVDSVWLAQWDTSADRPT